MSKIELRGVIVPSNFDQDWLKEFVDKGMITPESFFRRQLAEASTGEALEIHVNSPGGSVFAAHEMANAVKQWKIDNVQPVNVIVGALSASAASDFIITAATSVRAHQNSQMMFHGATSDVFGGGQGAMEDKATLLGKINAEIQSVLVTKFKMDPDTVADWFAEGRAGWLNATEMKEAGIISEIIGDDAKEIAFDDAAIKTIDEHGLSIAAVLDVKRGDLNAIGQPANASKTGTPPPLPTGAGGTDGNGGKKPDPKTPEGQAYQRGEAEGEAKARNALTIEYSGKLTDLTAQAKKSGEESSKFQGERDTARSELATLRTESKARSDELTEQLNTATGTIKQYMSGALKFEPAPEPVDTWEKALEECGGDYAAAKAKYPEILEAYKKSKGESTTMKTASAILIVGLSLLAGDALAGDLFTDITSHYPPAIVTQANAALDALEDSIDGTTPMESAVVQGTLTGISTNGASTNTLIDTNGRLVLDDVTTLAAGKIVIGDATGVGQGQTISGDMTISTSGVAAVAAGVIVNADINASAAIAASKLAADVARSGDTTAAPYIQTGTFTNGQAVVTFDNPFKSGTVPAVLPGWTTEDISNYSALTNVSWSAGVIVSNQFAPKTLAVVGDALTNANYIAIGQLPD